MYTDTICTCLPILLSNDDVIKSGGYRIGPAEIEESLMKHVYVQNAAVIGVPDPQGLRGDCVKAFIVLHPNALRQYMTDRSIDNITEGKERLSKEIGSFVKTKLAAHEYPRLIEFIDSLPQTTTGKIIRNDLKKLEEQRRKGQATTAFVS
jgi:acetyl-CoA synthetase